MRNQTLPEPLTSIEHRDWPQQSHGRHPVCSTDTQCLSCRHMSSKGGWPLKTCNGHKPCSLASAELAVPTNKIHPDTSQQDSP